MTTAGTDRLLIESVMPTFDATIAEHAIVAADPITTFHAARTLDFLSRRPHLGLSDRAHTTVGGVDVAPGTARAVVR